MIVSLAFGFGLNTVSRTPVTIAGRIKNKPGAAAARPPYQGQPSTSTAPKYVPIVRLKAKIIVEQRVDAYMMMALLKKFS